LKVGLALVKIAQACGLRRSPGLAAVPRSLFDSDSNESGAATFPWRCPFLCANSGRVREQWAMRRSGRGSTYSALQSRGGDGLFHVWLRFSSELTHRLPVHEVRGDCGGSLLLATGPVWV